VHKACSGAVVDDIIDRARYPQEPPQVSWLDGTTDVVTIMIGGNDAGFIPAVVTCLAPGPSCTRIDPEIERRLSGLSQRLPALYRELRRRSPQARILVVGYPQIFPDPSQVTIEACRMVNIGGIGIDSDEASFVRQKVTQVNQTIHAAAREGGVEFVDEEGALAGHEVCTKSPWVFGALPFSSGLTFHPSADGHQAMAKRLAAVLMRPRQP
jgi:lysophospholipase L1-like esterase